MGKHKSNCAANVTARKKSRGFALVAFLIWLPPLLSILFSIGSLSFILREKTRLQSICVSHLFRMHDQVATQLNHLLKLNTKAKKLRSDELRAQLRLQRAVLTGNPILIAIAETKLAKVQIASAQLGVEQKQIIVEANQNISATAVRLRSILRSNILNQTFPNLQIEADLPADVAPIYRTPLQFTQKQKASVHFKINWLPVFDQQWQKSLAFQCAMSIEQRSFSYRAKIMPESYANAI